MEKQTYYVIGNEFYHYIKVFDEDEKDEALASLEEDEVLHKVTIHDIKCSLFNMRGFESYSSKDDGYEGEEMVEIDIDASIDDERGEFTFYVQTTHGEVRGEFNCWVISQNGTGGDYEFDDKENLVARCLDLEEIAEDYMESVLKEEDVYYPLDNTGDYLTVLSRKGDRREDYYVVRRNANYINKVSTSLRYKYYRSYERFDSLEEAVKWIEENFDEINESDYY